MPDPSYGSGGIAYVAAGTYMSNQVAAALQADGSVVLGGSADSVEVVTRLTPAGQLDPAFGTGGVQALFATASPKTSIAITDAGNTLIVASDLDANWLMMRIMSDGHPDPLFGVELLSAFHSTDQAIVAPSGAALWSPGHLSMGLQISDCSFTPIRSLRPCRRCHNARSRPPTAATRSVRGGCTLSDTRQGAGGDGARW